MNRNFKRVLAGLAALTLCAGIAPTTMPSVISNMAIVASAEVDLADYLPIPDSDAYYKIDSNTLYVDSNVEDSVIPYNCFRNIDISGVEIAKIGKNVTKIGQSAFLGCTDLKEVYMTDVTEVDGGAFGKCGLTIVSMPNVTSVGNGAFADCSDLTTLNMPNVASVGGNAFHNCKFTTVYMPNVTNIDSNAFYDCGNLTTVYMPNVTSVKGHAFGGCNLSEITLGANPPVNFEKAFLEFAFDSAKFLIPAGSEANYAAFARDFEFETYVAIPEGYTQIGDSKTYYKNSEDDTTLYVDGIGSVPGNTSPYSKVFPNSAQKYIFGEDITSIGEYIFLGIWGAFEVEFLGDTVFEKNSFQSCRDGVSLVIPNVTSLNEAAFNDTPIISAKLGANPPQNFDKVFTNDTKILIPFDAYENYKSLEADGYKFYDYDGNVLTFEVPEGYTRVGNSKTCFKIEGDTMTVIGDESIYFSVFSDENSGYVIPDYVKNIKVGNQINTVYGPIAKGREFDSVDLSSVQYIGSPLFEDTKIGTLDISGSSNLNPDFIINCDIDNVYFGKTVPNYMAQLASTHTLEGAKIYIPSDVYESDYKKCEDYGYNFYDYEGNPLTFQAPEGYTKIFNSTTYYKIVDDTLYIEGEGSITEHAFNVGFSNGLYKGIELPETVKKVVIADAVTEIGNLAFVYCPYIESVEIKGETVVGSAAFAGCKDLKSVKAEKVTVLNGSSFSSGSIETIKLGSIVPENFINSYAITSTKILIPESAYENYSKYQENGCVFADYDGNLLTSGIKNLISGVRFTLDGKIGVNIVTALLPDEITVTCDGKKLDIIRGDFCDTFYVAAKDMVKTYTIEAAGESFDINPEKILAIYDQPGYGYARNAANALADYCKAASAYFDKDDSTKVAVIDDTIDLSEYADKTPDDGNTYKTSLVLESETALKVYISNENGIIAKEGQEQINANTVCVKFANIAAGSLDKSFDVNGGSFSAYGYIKKAVEQSDDENLANLCKALYKYNEATK